METTSFILSWVIGVCAGWISVQVNHDPQQSVAPDLIFALLGSLLGGLIFEAAGEQGWGLLGALSCSTIGATAMLVGLRAIKKT